LWYTSGIESFISTMETSALSGKNVARLIRDEWVAGKAEESERQMQAHMMLFGGSALWEEEL
jgi:prenylcysteine oxidase/farnesylcysteine lyase